MRSREWTDSSRSSCDSPARTPPARWSMSSMPEHAAAPPLPDPSTAHLLSPKWLTARAHRESGRRARSIFLLVFGFVFWGFIYVMLYRLLSYLQKTPEIGTL